MKNIFQAIALTAGITALTACSDFLSQNSPTEYKPDDVFESIDYTQYAVNKLYGDMAQDETYSQAIPILWGLNSDCELVDGLGSDAYNTSHQRGVMNYNVTPGWSNLSRVWDALYGIIESSNLIIKGIEESSLMTGTGSDRQAMERYKGEALTIRAMVYLDLVRFFGDVPMPLQPSESDLSNAYLEKTDRDVILDNMITSLEEAVELLPWAGEVSGYTTEHVTKGYAHALLANIALTRAGWAIREGIKAGYETAEYSDPVYPTQRCGRETRTQMYELALKHLSAVITNGTHRLNPSFENEWYLLNQLVLDETYRENLFEIPMGMGITGELGYSIGVRANYQSKNGRNSSGSHKLTAPYFWSFRDHDLRRDITCADYELREQGDGVVKETMLSNAPFGIYVGKWDIRKMNNDITSLINSTPNGTKWMTGINCVRMRYSQVLLMYAETLNELAGSPTGHYEGDAGITAQEALRQVHTRAYDSAYLAEAEAYVNSVSTSKRTFFNALVDENAWELAGEGCRKFDLIRWNLLVKKIEQFKQDYLRQVQDASTGYPERIYYNYSDAAQTTLDMSSVTWKGLPDGKSSSDYDGYTRFWGYERNATDKTQSETNLPSISSGLVGDNVTVKNRYLMPIASTTISASNGTLYNSYGYTN